MTQGDLPPLPPQHPGGFIWEPHAGRMRIVTDAEWGALADDLLPAVREAAAALANPLIRGANIHPMIVERAARLTELLSGDMPEVAARVPRVYMASLWLAEKYDTDRKLRGANDPMGEPLSDEMRAALVDLMAVLPSFVRQFPKVLQIEADREEFFADALPLDAAERAATGAEEARLIAPEDAQPLTEGVAVWRGEGPLADRAGRSVVRSLRNLASAGFVAGAVFGHVTGFVSGEVLGGIADGVGIEIRAPMGRWVRGRHEDIQTLFATAPSDLRIAIAQHVEALMNPGPIPAPPAPPVPKGRTWIVDPKPGRGDFTMIQPAIDAAADGDTVVVREGRYRESLRLGKDISLRGDGDPSNINVVSNKGNALHCFSGSGTIFNLRLVAGLKGKGLGLLVSGGSAEFHSCIIRSFSLASAVIRGKHTSPKVKHCDFTAGAMEGLIIEGGASVKLISSIFYRNSKSGVSIKDVNTYAEFIECKALTGQAGGFVFRDGANGTLTRCEAHSNAHQGVAIGSGAKARLSNCKIEDNLQAGVLIFEHGKGLLDTCSISNNKGNGIWVQENGAVTVIQSRLKGNRQSAVWIPDPNSTGTFRNNDLRGNAHGPWDIAEGATIIDENNLT